VSALKSPKGWLFVPAGESWIAGVGWLCRTNLNFGIVNGCLPTYPGVHTGVCVFDALCLRYVQLPKAGCGKLLSEIEVWPPKSYPWMLSVPSSPFCEVKPRFIV
jgi:hypothetical protein